VPSNITVTKPMPNTPYEQLGGDAGVRALVDRFYQLMDSLPEAAAIRALHPTDLAGSREKLYKFLSGWLGGPPLYVEQYGHPMLRARHLPFPIAEVERDAWMRCMTQAVEERVSDPALRAHLLGALLRTADHMRNK
jgi:hemoglobin